MTTIVEVPGIGEVEFPDGMDQEQIANAIQNLEPPEQAVPSQSQGVYATMESMAPGMSAVPRFSEGIVRGLQNFGTGVEQLQNTLDPYKPAEEKAQRASELKSEIALRDLRIGNLGGMGVTGSMVGETAPSAILPGGPGGGLIKRVAGGVASDVMASVADPVREDETRLGNLQKAAMFSGGIRVAGSGIPVLANKIANARAGNYKSEDIKKLIDTASAEDIRLFYQDVSEGALARKASVATESVFGVGSRRTQNKEAQAAANRWLSDVSGDTDDYAELVQTGIGRKLDIFKRRASQMYGRVGKAIDDGAEVVTPKFDAAANKAIAAETAKGTRADKRVIEFLERYRDAPRGNFDEMIEFRSEMLRDLRRLDGSITSERALSHSARDSISSVIDTINDDMGEFSAKYGAKDLWLKANRFYYDNVVQFQRGKLKNFLNEDSAANFDQQAAWRYLRSQSNEKRARMMWQSLDAKGRNAVRQGLLQEAVDAATPTSGPFSPAKFAAYLEKQMPNVEQFFRGGKREEIKGLINIMRHVERSGQILENPPTGMRVIPYLLGAGTIASPEAAAVGAASLGGMKVLFETKSGRNLLLAANTATPGSQEFNMVVSNIEKFLSRASN
jgi:hypothetical protein